MLTPNGVTLSAYNTAVKAGARSHVRITFTAQNIVLEDVDIEASGVHVSDYLNGETELTFGKSVSKAVVMNIFNSSKLNGLMWSSEFKLEIGLEVSGSTRWNTIGYFSGKRPEKVVTVDIITFNATDRMKKFDVIADAWLDSLTYPKTVWQMFTSLCDYVGIGYVSGDELANMKARSYAAAPIVNRGLTCRTILSAIAEACGCYAKINEDGNCQLVWFEDHTGDYTLTGDDEFSLSVFENVPGKTWEELEGYTWEDLENVTWEELEGTAELFKVDAVVVKQTEDDIGVAYPGSTNGRNYIIVDNPFLITANATEVNNYVKPLYDRLNTFGGYVPASVNAIGNALIESGDIINITSGSQVIRMPLFIKETVWNGALTDGYECTGDVNQSDITAETRERLAEGGRYHKFKNTVDQLYSELYDAQTGDITVLNQRTNAIELVASKKVRTYYANSAPTGTAEDPLEEGDIWFDTANGNKAYRWSGSAWTDVSDSTKYTIQSGIDIKPAGIEITGGKYIKIMSGGSFDVDSTNFKINSTAKEIVMGNWKFNDVGEAFNDPDEGKFELCALANETQDATAGIYYDLNKTPQDLFNGNIVLKTVHGYLGTFNTHKLTIGYTYNSAYQRIPCLYADANIEVFKPTMPASTVYSQGFSGTNGYIYLYTDYDVGSVQNPTGVQFSKTSSGVVMSSIGRSLVLGETSDHIALIYGEFMYASAYNQYSSKEIKDDIIRLESIGDTLDQLTPVSFTYKRDPQKKKHYGLIYEDTIDVLPEICCGDPEGEAEEKAINYMDIVPMLLKEIQELRLRVKKLEKGDDK